MLRWIAEREKREKKQTTTTWRHISSGITFTSQITWWWMEVLFIEQTANRCAYYSWETGTQKPPVGSGLGLNREQILSLFCVAFNSLLASFNIQIHLFDCFILSKFHFQGCLCDLCWFQISYLFWGLVMHREEWFILRPVNLYTMLLCLMCHFFWTLNPRLFSSSSVCMQKKRTRKREAFNWIPQQVSKTRVQPSN